MFCGTYSTYKLQSKQFHDDGPMVVSISFKYPLQIPYAWLKMRSLTGHGPGCRPVPTWPLQSQPSHDGASEFSTALDRILRFHWSALSKVPQPLGHRKCQWSYIGWSCRFATIENLGPSSYRPEAAAECSLCLSWLFTNSCNRSLLANPSTVRSIGWYYSGLCTK